MYIASMHMLQFLRATKPVLWAKPTARSLAATFLVLFAIISALVTVPYLLPVHWAVAESYCLGFNNRAAQILLLGSLFAFGLWHGPVAVTQPEEPYSPATRVWGWLAFLTLVVCGIEFFLQWHLGPRGEGGYFLDRLTHLAAGERVYRDFELAYGAILLYIPLALSRLFGLSLLSAYSLSLLLENLLGLLLMWFVIQTVASKSPHRNAIFCILALTGLAWMPLAPGQYTLLRYWIAPASALFSLKLFRDGRFWTALCALIAGFSVTMLTSEEQAIALFLGTWTFGLGFLYRQWKQVLPGLILFSAAAGLIFRFAYKARALDTVLAIGSGAYMLPIVLSPFVVLVVLLLAVAACVFVERVRTRSGGSAEDFLLCIAPWLLSAAFGRCDPQHMLSNTFTGALVAWVTVARNRMLWRGFFWAYVVLVFLYPTQLKRIYRAEWTTFRAWLHSPKKTDWSHRPIFYSPNVQLAPAWNGTSLPFYTRTGRYYGVTDVVLPRQVNEIIEELRVRTEHGQLALVNLGGCHWAVDAEEIENMTGSPLYAHRALAVPFMEPLCTEMRSKRYRVIERPGLKLPAPFALITSRE